jgi:hypothetical protein
MLLQLLQHVAVADIGAHERHLQLAHRAFEAIIAHQGADQRAVQAAAALPVARQHVEDFVAVDQRTAAIDHLDAVAVAVERDAEIGAGVEDRARQGVQAG